MAPTRVVSIQVIDAEVRAGDSQGIDTVLMVAIEVGNFVCGGNGNVEVGPIDASGNFWESTDLVEILCQSGAIRRPADDFALQCIDGLAHPVNGATDGVRGRTSGVSKQMVEAVCPKELKEQFDLFPWT